MQTKIFHSNIYKIKIHKRLRVQIQRVGLVTLFLFKSGLISQEPINPPAGPYLAPQPSQWDRARRFESGKPLVLTPYFYWYDVWTGSHIANPDGSDALTTHPPSLTGFSYKSVQWHKKQLLDMMEAGMDVLLPVYWGAPSELRQQGLSHWSYAGLTPLVKARADLIQDGLTPPAIGLFYDTSTLEYNSWNRKIDLTTPEGRQWFYESVRDFFSLVPAEHWALVDGRVPVFLYSASFAAAHDQSVIEFASEKFKEDFSGMNLFWVKEISWNVEADAVYAWGGALGLKNPGVGSLGPGYDHSAVPGRDPLIVDREDGAFFERNWIRFLRSGSWMAFVETWNEFHEGTDIAHSLEYGRNYIELNRKYVDFFRSGEIPGWPDGPFSGADTVEWDPNSPDQKGGLEHIQWADGKSVVEPALGLKGVRTVETQHQGRYLYFKADDSFKWAGKLDVELEVTYFDGLGLVFAVQYDGSDPNAPFQGAYTQAETVVRSRASHSWKIAVVPLPEARFLNSQNGGADFRMVEVSGKLHLAKVVLRRPGGSQGEPDGRSHSLNWGRSPDGSHTLFVQGPVGYRYVLERSTDLKRWAPVASRKTSEGENRLEYELVGDFPRVFFRASRL